MSSTRFRPQRQVFVNREHQKFCSNKISTCKYNVFSFLPRFLLEQFRRYSNIFFLTSVFLQQIPDISPVGRYTTLVPFLMILCVSGVKEIFEDLRRKKMDMKVNKYEACVLRDSVWTTTSWKSLKVGEIVRVKQDCTFPADLVILASSEPEGVAYIETSNLDGETNLKIRQAHSFTADFITIQQLSDTIVVIECESPSVHVNEFTGTLTIGRECVPIGISHLLLRGANLKNTNWIIGAVVYTGHDARLLMNSKTAPLKRSNIDTLTNNRIVFLFLTLITLSVISAIGAQLYISNFLYGAWYVDPVDNDEKLNAHEWDFLSIVWSIFTFFILYNNLIPISLQVTLEGVRFFQASYINSDIQMYDELSDTPANARTSNLNEELGQIKFLMTDKTGTLTCNVMKFKRCSVGGVSYGYDDSDEFCDEKMLDVLRMEGSKAANVRELLLMMSTCHTVVPEKKSNGEFVYRSSSPDEGALVRGASTQGFVFHARHLHEIVVNTSSAEIVLQLLNVLEFTSDRKRMSIIVRDIDGAIKLYCKGADNIIMSRLSKQQNNLEDMRVFQQHLYEYSCKGYRTLCFATRQLDVQFYAEWAKRFRAACISLENREAKLTDVAEEIERDLRFVGITAIEDRLQDHVPCTIRSLLAADIHVWILTGDKRETAINIAQSSALCTKKTKLMTLDTRSYEEVLANLNDYLEQARQYTKEGVEFALVISGSALHKATKGEARRVFTQLALICHAVICCRLTPMQKAEIVEIVREFTHQVVLAVGDGANDVAMIQAANVGVGITGEEGLQAASASDYSIAQFHFLRRLIFVHGTWNYDRTVKVIMYSFYKNICLYIIELWFAFFSAFSGQTIFERWIIASFNMFFTAFPPMILGLFDRPVPAQVIIRHPWLYPIFHELAFSHYRFVLWIAMALWHSLLLFFLSYGIFRNQVVWDNGLTGGWLMLGNSCYTFVIVTVCLKALLECDSWTFVIWFSCIGSILFWFFYIILYSLVWPHLSFGANVAGMAWIMFSSVTFWLSLIFIPITTLLTDFVIKSISSNLWQTPYESLRSKERHRMHGEKNRLDHLELFHDRHPEMHSLVDPINFDAELAKNRAATQTVIKQEPINRPSTSTTTSRPTPITSAEPATSSKPTRKVSTKETKKTSITPNTFSTSTCQNAKVVQKSSEEDATDASKPNLRRNLSAPNETSIS